MISQAAKSESPLPLSLAFQYAAFFIISIFLQETELDFIAVCTVNAMACTWLGLYALKSDNVFMQWFSLLQVFAVINLIFIMTAYALFTGALYNICVETFSAFNNILLLCDFCAISGALVGRSK